jgi:CRP/FNR family transcriptional regulator
MNILPLRDTPDHSTANVGMPTANGDRREWTSLHEMLDLIGVPVGDVPPVPVASPTVRRLKAGETLFMEGAPTAFIYVVRTGTLKLFRTAEDGYEQVFGFVHRGDLLGCDALSGARHLLAAVALEDASVLAISLSGFYGLAQQLPAFGRGAMSAVSHSMIELIRLSDMVAAVSAEVRLARFLVHLSRRMAAGGRSESSLRLQMTRRDIGSYLGVAHETVSRSFAALAEAGLIDVEQRKVEILDPDALQHCAQGPRGTTSAELRALPAALRSSRRQRLALAA